MGVRRVSVKTGESCSTADFGELADAGGAALFHGRGVAAGCDEGGAEEEAHGGQRCRVTTPEHGGQVRRGPIRNRKHTHGRLIFWSELIPHSRAQAASRRRAGAITYYRRHVPASAPESVGMTMEEAQLKAVISRVRSRLAAHQKRVGCFPEAGAGCCATPVRWLGCAPLEPCLRSRCW